MNKQTFTHHNVLLYDVWVFTDRLNKEHLREKRGGGVIMLGVAVSECSTPSLSCDPTTYLKTILLGELDDGFPPFSGGVCCIKNLSNTKTEEGYKR